MSHSTINGIFNLSSVLGISAVREPTASTAMSIGASSSAASSQDIKRKVQDPTIFHFEVLQDNGTVKNINIIPGYSASATRINNGISNFVPFKSFIEIVNPLDSSKNFIFPINDSEIIFQFFKHYVLAYQEAEGNEEQVFERLLASKNIFVAQLRKKYGDLSEEELLNSARGGDAFTLGRSAKIPQRWHEEYKVRAMIIAILVKALSCDDFLSFLLATGSSTIVETTDEACSDKGMAELDTSWGVSQGKGQSLLGQCMQLIRDSLLNLLHIQQDPEYDFARNTQDTLNFLNAFRSNDFTVPFEVISKAIEQGASLDIVNSRLPDGITLESIQLSELPESLQDISSIKDRIIATLNGANPFDALGISIKSIVEVGFTPFDKAQYAEGKIHDIRHLFKGDNLKYINFSQYFFLDRNIWTWTGADIISLILSPENIDEKVFTIDGQDNLATYEEFIAHHLRGNYEVIIEGFNSELLKEQGKEEDKKSADKINKLKNLVSSLKGMLEVIKREISDILVEKRGHALLPPVVSSATAAAASHVKVVAQSSDTQRP